MPKIRYTQTMTNFRADSITKIDKANEIIEAYAAQGLDLTLRQLYYQFVSRNLIKNNEKEYKNLGKIISEGRMAGLIDWDAIVDRTRFLRSLPHWDSPQSIIDYCATQFRVDKWKEQPCYLEVFIEKDALIGVIEGVCTGNDVSYLACRGYASASEIWNAGRNRLKPRREEGKKCVVLYLGDHDPSGIDMTRDIRARLELFSEGDVEVRRLALNMDQVTEYNPPPNPTKMTDSRAGWYVKEYGHECWELDALDPIVIRDLIQAEIDRLRKPRMWKSEIRREEGLKRQLQSVANFWDDAVAACKN